MICNVTMAHSEMQNSYTTGWQLTGMPELKVETATAAAAPRYRPNGEFEHRMTDRHIAAEPYVPVMPWHY